MHPDDRSVGLESLELATGQSRLLQLLDGSDAVLCREESMGFLVEVQLGTSSCSVGLIEEGVG